MDLGYTAPVLHVHHALLQPGATFYVRQESDTVCAMVVTGGYFKTTWVDPPH
jgi:hypothetical protein